MKTIFLSLKCVFFLILFSFLSACQKGSENNSPPVVKEEEKVILEFADEQQSGIEFDYKEGGANVRFKSNYEWEASAPSWATITPAQGKAGSSNVNITVSENSSNRSRLANAVISSKEKTLRFSLKQNGLSEDIDVPSDVVSIDGKGAVFIGNSFLYYGGAVEKGNYRKTDAGMFYHACKANREHVSVYDCTYGSHNLRDFTEAGCRISNCTNSGCGGTGSDLLRDIDLAGIDLVFMSESGSNNANFLEDCRAIMDRFKTVNPDVRFFYLSHSYTYTNNHTRISSNLPALQNQGVTIVEWGKLAYDLMNKNVTSPESEVTFNKNSFIVNKNDTHHPNPLSGYLAAQMAYSAATNRSAVGQTYDYCSTVKCDNQTGFDNFIQAYYKTVNDTNMKQIFASQSTMNGLQSLMDNYLQQWSR